jgi:hypothetical protein
MQNKNSEKQTRKSNFKEELEEELEEEATAVAIEQITEITIPISKTGLVFGGIGLFFGLF